MVAGRQVVDALTGPCDDSRAFVAEYHRRRRRQGAVDGADIGVTDPRSGHQHLSWPGVVDLDLFYLQVTPGRFEDGGTALQPSGDSPERVVLVAEGAEELLDLLTQLVSGHGIDRTRGDLLESLDIGSGFGALIGGGVET